MLKKADVKNPKQHPLYHYLLEQSSSSKEIVWNFEKFLVGRDGQIKRRFSSGIKPLSKVMVSAVKKELEN
ncbi:MAG: hypothetical protein MRK01_08530 [Candidatus Scalindua sp.]|nr:hypothetical protein [Candidatus Scalindua sp.]